ncbi:MAG TPA: response regulator [Flavisolibacter sp.]
MLRCLLVDDEPNSAELLAMKLRNADDPLDIVGISHDAESALKEVEKKLPDVIFVDVEMPGIDGITFARGIDTEKSELVFVTAFNQYAIEAIRLKAMDYLLKPVDDEDLARTLVRLKEKIYHKQQVQQQLPLKSLFHQMQVINSEYNKIPVSTLDSILFILVKDIIRIEALSNYSKIYLLSGKTVTTSKTLKHLEEQLNIYRFLRPHKSHLVNVRYITRYSKADNFLQLQDGSRIEVSRQRKADILSQLDEG